MEADAGRLALLFTAAKDHCRGRQVQTPCTRPDSVAANEVRLLLSLIAANLMHAASALLQREEPPGRNRKRFRQLFLKTPLGWC